jgi:hypothetical protein
MNWAKESGMLKTGTPCFQPNAMATGIGSLPFAEPEAVLALIREHLPDIPPLLSN